MIAETLERLCRRGPWRLGQLVVSRSPEGVYTLQHRDDVDGRREPGSLPERFTTPEEVRDRVRYNATGDYRPLKGAPTLAPGWAFETASAEDLRRALDFIYPGAIGSWLAWHSGDLQVVNLRQTLERQSGMYRVTRKITDDAADQLIGRFCRPDTGCLRTILWRIREERPVTTLPAVKFDPEAGERENGVRVPVLCFEACNLLVAQARTVVKQGPA